MGSAVPLQILICALLLQPFAFGQADHRPQTFHVKGTIEDQLHAIVLRAEVHFIGNNVNRTVIVDDNGFYQLDLPIGVYTMTAELPWSGGPNHPSPFTKYTRIFEVRSAMNVTLNGFLYAQYSCDGVWPGEDAEEAYKDSCGGEDSVPFPSEDNAPLSLDIRYARRSRGRKLLSYTSIGAIKRPVLVTYNLFVLQADSVEYSPADGEIRAYGHVMLEDQPGPRIASSAAFRFEDGKAIRISFH